MRCVLVLNAAAGDGAAATLEARARTRVADLEVIALSDLWKHTSLRCDRLVVAGGDGSVGGVFALAAVQGCQLAVIPTGTASDFARALDLPTDVDAALALALDPASSTHAVWGGSLDGRPFVNVAAAGLAVEAAERATPLKHWLGPLAYAAGALRAAVAPTSVRVQVAEMGVDAPRLGADLRAHQIMVAASGRFGGAATLGSASPEAARLTITIVPAKRRRDLPRRAIGLLRGTLEEQPDVATWEGAEAHITAHVDGRPARWDIDGEVVRMPFATIMASTLGPVRVVVPPPAAAPEAA